MSVWMPVCLDVRTSMLYYGGPCVGCYGHLDGCVYKHPYGRQYGLNVQNTTGILSGYRGWKKSCTTKVHGLKLLHGTVRLINGPPFPPTSMLRGFVVGRLLPKCVLDPPPFRMEEKLHHFGFPDWTARSTSNIDVGGKGGPTLHIKLSVLDWTVSLSTCKWCNFSYFHRQDPSIHLFSSLRGHFVACSCGEVLVVWQ